MEKDSLVGVFMLEAVCMLEKCINTVHVAFMEESCSLVSQEMWSGSQLIDSPSVLGSRPICFGRLYGGDSNLRKPGGVPNPQNHLVWGLQFFSP